MFALLLLAGCASAPVGLHGLPEKAFDMPALGTCPSSPSLSEAAVSLRALEAVLGRYPPKFLDEAHREAVYAQWSELRSCAEALPADTDAERRLYLLAELYRQGHNMDVAGAAEKAAENLRECLAAFSNSEPCNVSATYFYLSIRPTPENLAMAERSLDTLRALALPGFSDDAEAGFVFLYLYKRDPEATRSQIGRYLELFPNSERADDFRKLRGHLGNEIEYKEY